MTKFVRLAALAAAATVVAAPAFAVPVSNGPVTATARIIKPLILEKTADMDFGTITVQDAGTVTMDATTGAVTCTANLTCTGTTTAAGYSVKGTNSQWVTITKPSVILTNTDLSGTTLTVNLTGLDQVQLSSSGMSGTPFTLGGTISVPASQREGTYQGDLNVTVNY